MNAKDIKRLMELLSKGAEKLSEAEKAELTALQAKQAKMETDEATAAAAKAAEVAAADGMSAEEVKTTVETAVKAALAGSSVSEAQIKAVMETALKGIKPAEIDVKAITEAVKNSLPKSLTGEEIKAVVETAMKGFRSESKMLHSEGESVIETPIAHRAGNLSVADKQLLNVMTKKSMNDGIPESLLNTATERGERAEKRLLTSIGTKALTTSGSGTGAEFMNSTLSSVLLQRFYMDSLLAQRFVAREIQMPTNPFKYPLSTTRPVFRSGVAEGAAPTASTPGTGDLTLEAAKLTGMVEFSDEADEDSIIAILPNVTEQLGQAAGEALEDAILNGDTAGTQDSGGAAGDALRLWDGVRKLTLAQAQLNISLATGGASTTNIGAMKKRLGKWGMNPKDLLIVAGPNGYNDIVLLPETLTAEKAGSAAIARILTGLAPNLLGMDVIPSAKVREDLNASGVFDNTTTTKGSLHIIHMPSWILGVRRGFNVETYRDPRSGQNYVIANFRRAFKPMESLATIRGAVTGFNYASA